MKTLTSEQYEKLIKDTEVLVQNKIRITKTNEIIKTFRAKSNFSTDRFRPYALRFQENAERLKDLGLNSLEISEVYYVPSLKQYLVRYPLLEGANLREFLKKNPQQSEVIDAIPNFIAEIHSKGIYFRGLHFENILLMPDGGFTLLDFSDAHFYEKSLDPWRRARNFRAFLRQDEDWELIIGCGVNKFVNQYLEASDLSLFAQKIFLRWLILYSPKLKEYRS